MCVWGGVFWAAETDAMIGRRRRGGGLCMTLKTHTQKISGGLCMTLKTHTQKIKAAEHGGGCGKWKRRKKKKKN